MPDTLDSPMPYSERQTSIYNLQPEQNYTVEIALKTSNDTINDTLVKVNLREGRGNATFETFDINATNFTNTSKYQTFMFNFTAPSNYTSDGIGVEVITTSSSANLSFDSIQMEKQGGAIPTMTVNFPFSGNYTFTVASGTTMVNDSKNGYIIVDGVMYQGTMNSSSGLEQFDLQNMSMGSHIIQFGYPLIYAMNYGLQNGPSQVGQVNVSYQRMSSTEYMINESSPGPGWVLLSEGYNPYWVAEMDGKPLLHVEVDSVVSAYYVPEGGNHTITVQFLGQGAYINMLWEMAYFVMGGTLIFRITTSPIVLRKLKIK